MLNRLHPRTVELFATALIVVLDQATKPLVRAKLELYESATVVPGFLSLTHVRNTGAAFGLLNGISFPFKTPILIGLAIVALASIGIYAMSLPPEQRLSRFGLALILGGAVGNLIDRVRVGYVLDFVDVYWREYHFWAFNVADSAITVGVTIILFDLLLEYRRTPARHETGPAGTH